MTAPVRVLRLITRLNAGGPARHVVWLTRGLAEHGYKTRLVSGDVAPGESDLSLFAASQGVDVLRVPGLSREIDPLADVRAIGRVARIIREFDPAIVHTHTAKAGLVGRLALRLVNTGRHPARRIRAVHTFHGNVLSGYFSPPKDAVFRWLERRLGHGLTDAVAVLSPEQRAEIVERFKVAPADRTYVVPLALDLSPFESLPERGALRRELEITDDAFVIGIVGRIAPVKNHAMFLRAAARARREEPRLRFVVVGEGTGLLELGRLAASLGLEDAVRFAGLRTDLPRIYSDLDAVALTSRNEGTPLSLIEAMACARPIVATAAGGVADLLTREWEGDIERRVFRPSASARGLLVGLGDEEGFASAMVRLSRDAALGVAFGEAGRRYAFAYHGLPRLLDDLDRLYRRILPA